MKFIHIADLHLGAKPDAGNAYSQNREQELWDSFRDIITICKPEEDRSVADCRRSVSQTTPVKRIKRNEFHTGDAGTYGGGHDCRQS